MNQKISSGLRMLLTLSVLTLATRAKGEPPWLESGNKSSEPAVTSEPSWLKSGSKSSEPAVTSEPSWLSGGDKSSPSSENKDGPPTTTGEAAAPSPAVGIRAAASGGIKPPPVRPPVKPPTVHPHPVRTPTVYSHPVRTPTVYSHPVRTPTVHPQPVKPPSVQAPGMSPGAVRVAKPLAGQTHIPQPTIHSSGKLGFNVNLGFGRYSGPSGHSRSPYERAAERMTLRVGEGRRRAFQQLETQQRYLNVRVAVAGLPGRAIDRLSPSEWASINARIHAGVVRLPLPTDRLKPGNITDPAGVEPTEEWERQRMGLHLGIEPSFGFDDLITLLSLRSAMGKVGAAAGSKVLPDAARVAEPALAGSRAQLAGALRARALQLAGFTRRTAPIILDESVQIKGMTSKGIAEALRARGFNVRSVDEVFGKLIKVLEPGHDFSIRKVADTLGARVLARDMGHDVGGGFGRLTIKVLEPGHKPTSIESLVKSIKTAKPVPPGPTYFNNPDFWRK